ncbi:PGF-pre-PGF domain-containing protein [Halogeometricum sp. S1BR25-6]|uniref:PGF-pre-PGF domain-containing protein n=1 Tax=Halogeometricum salsisoli TaxID=2950536 RepID=A0ABU2GCT8_9EURY|nr:PGF-pre-PGF domain-containing protein [Halogeometricum sp. S1BR25-6]MDS0298617.1 PGF-pre-PGF domain-containing protein [Halogeometricum sp. S1BR25-6]
MKGNRGGGGVSGGGGVVVLLVLVMAVTGGITSASAAACSATEAVDCRLAGGSAAAESAARQTSPVGSAGIVGAPPPWGNGPGSNGPPEKTNDDGDEADEENEDGNDGANGASDADSPRGGDAPGNGHGASTGSSAQGDSPGSDDAPDRSGEGSERTGADAGRPTNATHSGEAAGNGSAGAAARAPPAAVPASVNLTARGRAADRDETVVNASVGEIRRNQRVSIDLDARRNALLNRSNASDVAISTIDLTPTRNGSFTMNLTTAERIEGSPEFETDDGAETLSHIRVDHSISNAEVNGTVEIGFEVSKARLGNESVAPENVALYRYENGSWTELPTDVVGETNETVRFRAASPGLSEFAAGAKRARFTVETVDVAVAEITVGDGVRVHVTVGNDGGADGEFLAQLILDGRPVEERSLTIAAGGQRQTLFDHAVVDAGEYEVRVNDVVAGSVVVRRPVEEGSTGGAETDESATEPAATDAKTTAPTVTGTDVASPVFHPTALVFVALASVVARVRRRR